MQAHLNHSRGEKITKTKVLFNRKHLSSGAVWADELCTRSIIFQRQDISMFSGLNVLSTPDNTRTWVIKINVERGKLNLHVKKYIQGIQPNHGIIHHCTSDLISKHYHTKYSKNHNQRRETIHRKDPYHESDI